MAVRTETSILLVEEAARVRANTADQMRKDASALIDKAVEHEGLATAARDRAAQITQTAEQVQWESEDLADQAVRMRREAGRGGPVTAGPPRPAEERPTVAWPPVAEQQGQAPPLPPAVIDHHTTGEYARRALMGADPDTTLPDGRVGIPHFGVVVWDDSLPPGGYVCGWAGSDGHGGNTGICGVPVESQPCPEHGSGFTERGEQARPDATPGTEQEGETDE